MQNLSDYNIGDWIKDTQTGDVYEIIDKKVDIFTDWYTLVKKIDDDINGLITRHIKTSINTASLQSYFIKANVAQVLYK